MVGLSKVNYNVICLSSSVVTSFPQSFSHKVSFSSVFLERHGPVEDQFLLGQIRVRVEGEEPLSLELVLVKDGDGPTPKDGLVGHGVRHHGQGVVVDVREEAAGHFGGILGVLVFEQLFVEPHL